MEISHQSSVHTSDNAFTYSMQVYANTSPATNISQEIGDFCQAQKNTKEILILPECFSAKGKGFRDVLTYILMVCVAIITFSMGCKVKIREIWKRFRFPYGILLGALCQFGLMPLLAFILARMFNLSRAHALAIVIMGCIPGGNASNLVSYWCGGDMDLSIAMTAFSTMVAFAMTPLTLYAYGLALDFEGIRISFLRTTIVLASLVIPGSIGAAVNFRKPKIAAVISRVGAIVGGILLLCAASLAIILYPRAWNIPLSFWKVGAIMPIAGFASGFIFSYLIGRFTGFKHVNHKQIRTVAIETGMQNTHMCAAIMQVNYSCTCLVIEMIPYPIVYYMYEVSEALLLCIAYRVFLRLRRDGRSGEIETDGNEREIECKKDDSSSGDFEKRQERLLQDGANTHSPQFHIQSI